MKNYLLKIFFLIFLIQVSTFAQGKDINLFFAAVSSFTGADYSKAYEQFISVGKIDDLDDEVYSASEYFAAECLLALKQYDGAINLFSRFINKHVYSSIRPLALFRLGAVYFDLSEYVTARKKLLYLLEEYPHSEFEGSAFYLIGAAYSYENKLEEAIYYLKKAINSKRNNDFIDFSIYKLANIYERKRDFKNAVNEYDNLLGYYKESKLSPYAQLRIGISYFNTGEYENAILELTDPLINRLPEDKQNEALYMLANCYYKVNEYDKSKKTYSRLLAKNISFKFRTEISYGLAWVYFQQNKFEDAYKLFHNIAKLKTDSLSVSSFFWSAECKRYAGKTEKAKEILNAFLKKYPKHPLAAKAKLSLAILDYNNQNLLASEKTILNSLSSSDPVTRAKAYILLGEINLKKKKFTEAKDLYNKVNDIFNIPAELKDQANLGLGISEFYLKNYKAALHALNKAQFILNNMEKAKKEFYTAESYFILGDYKSALTHYNKIPNSTGLLQKESIYGKAYSYFNLKDFSNASYYFRLFLTKYRINKYYLDAKKRLAESYFGVKDFDKAGNVYKELIFSDGALANSDKAYYQYGQALFQSGKNTNAIEIFSQLQNKFPNSKYADESQYLIGWINFQQGLFNEAINDYQSVIEKYPGSTLLPIVTYSIGDSYFNLGEYDKAVNQYKKIIEEYPDTKYVYDAINGILYSYEASDKIDDANNFIDTFLREHPNSAYNETIFFKKGDLYYSVGDYKKAIKYYKEFLIEFPGSKLRLNANYWLGKSEANLGNLDSALEYFTNVINGEYNSEISISALLEAGKIYNSKKEYRKEIDLYDSKLNELSDKEGISEVYYQKGEAQIAAGDYQNAFATFLFITTKYPGSIFGDKAKIEIGIFYLVKSNYEQAESTFRDVAERRKDDIGAKAQYYYGVTLFEQNKLEDAITALVRVRSVYSAFDEWYTKSLLKLGDCYVKLNDKKNAKEMFSAVIRKHKTDDYAKEARKKLKEL